jgi:signal transduction histidine kinase
MICGDLTTASEAIDADFFICNENGDVIYCQEMRRSDMALYTGGCIIHDQIHIPKDILDTLQNGPYSGVTTLGGDPAEKNFTYATPVRISDETVAYVIGMQPVRESLRPYILAMLRMFGISAAITLAVALFAVYIMTYEMTKPLRQMSEATKRYAAGDFSMRVEVSGRNEMAELANAFNSMARDLASLESSRRSFVANVSHELKTPMTSIGGFIDGILDGTIPKEQETQYLRIVSKEIRRLSRIVVSMLNLSKIEAGEVDLSPVKYDIGAQLFETLLPFERTINEKDIQVEGFEDMGVVNVTADRDLIQQVIYNLLDNAVKFTPEGGTIYLHAKQTDKGVRVTIRNSGAGVSNEEISRIFERFYKVDKSRSFDVKGVGLGLYIVKTIINMHDGTIRASSKEGEYTEFSFELPN